MKNFLFDINTIKDKALVHENVDETQLKVIIERVQDTYIQDVLGTALYNDLQTKVANATTNTDEDTLLNDFILPYLAVCVDSKAVYSLLYELRSQGFGVTTDQTFRSAQLNELQAMQDNLREDMKIYRELLVKYLCENASKFPDYTNDDLLNRGGSQQPNISFL